MAPGNRRSTNLKLFQKHSFGNEHADPADRNIEAVAPRKKHFGKKRRFSELQHNEDEGTSMNLQEFNNQDINVSEVSGSPDQSFGVDVAAIGNITSLPSSSHRPKNRRSSRLKFFEEHSFGNEYVNPVELKQLLSSENISANQNIRDVAHSKKRTQRKKFTDLECVEGERRSMNMQQISHGIEISENSELSSTIDAAADTIASIENMPSSSCGQALYQRSRQDVVTEYNDDGDDDYQCIYCDANFWLGEANKHDRKNAPIVYTGCCQKGQVELEQLKPTPAFLEELLNPINGRESTLTKYQSL